MNSLSKFFCLMSSGLAMTACGSFETPSSRGPEVPGRFLEADSTAPRAATGWLPTFQDRRLVESVDRAMRSNNDLAAAAGRLRSARARVGVSRSVGLPQVSVNRGSGRSSRVAEIGGDRVRDYATTHDIGANLGWEIDLWGRLRNQRNAAQAEAGALAADNHAFRLSLAANIARSWFNASELELQTKLASETVASLEKNLRFLERGVDLGTSEALDLRLTRANLDNSRSNLEAQRRQLDRTTRALEILLGSYPANQLQAGDSLPDLSKPIPTGLPSTLLTRRPDLVASAQRVAAASERVLDSQKAILPSFRLTASGGSSSSDLRKLLNPDYLATSITARLAQTVYDGGRIRSETEAARGRFDEAVALYRQAALQAFGEVETALAAEKYLAKQLRFQKKAVTESVAAEDLAWEQYSRGLVEGLTWLEAQRRSFNARSGLLQLQNLRLQNRIDLHLALGGDFKTRPR